MKPLIRSFIIILCISICICSLLLLGAFFKNGFLDDLFIASIAMHPGTLVALILAGLSLILIFLIAIGRISGSRNQTYKALINQIKFSKEVQEKLTESNRVLDAIIENFPDIIFVKEPQAFKYVKINKATAEILNKGNEEVLGKTDYDLFSREEADKILIKDTEVLRNGKLSDVYEQPIVVKGNIHWFSTRKFPVLDDESKVSYIIGIAQDVTAQKEQQHQLHEVYKDLEKKVQDRTQELYKSEQRFRTLIESGLDLIKMMDAGGTIFFASKSHERVLGFTSEEMLQTNWLSYVHPEELEWSAEILEKAIQQPGVPQQATMKAVRKDGEYIMIAGSITSFLHDENVNALVCNFHDKTFELKVEEEKRLLEERLIKEKIERQKEIAQATLDGQEKERTAIGMEMHDNISQILGVVKLYLGLAKSRPEIMDEMIDKCNENIILCIKETRKLSKSLVTTNIHKYGVHFAIKDLIEDFKEGGLNFKYKVDEEKIKELDSKIQFSLYRIIQEQLNNILKHAEAKNVLIHIECINDKLILEISDDGKGFDTSTKHRGIGLSNIQNRVDLLNGTFEMQSSRGTGSKLIISIACK